MEKMTMECISCFCDEYKENGEGTHWYCCPHCGKKLFPIKENTRIEHLIYRCKACKHNIEVNVYPTKINNKRAKSL